MKQVNNNFAFSLMGFAGIFISIIGFSLISRSSLIDQIGYFRFILLFLNMLPAVIVIAWLLSLPRLYIENEFLIIKRGFKMFKPIPLKEIRAVKKISGFPFGFSYSDFICRYKIDFLNNNGDWQTVRFFNTMADDKAITEFLNTIKEENPFVKFNDQAC